MPGAYGKATELVEEVSRLVAARGDDTEAIRVTWLQGRIEA